MISKFRMCIQVSKQKTPIECHEYRPYRFPKFDEKLTKLYTFLQFEPRIYLLRVADARIQILYPVLFMITQRRFARGEGHPTKSKPQTTLHASVYTFGKGVSLIWAVRIAGKSTRRLFRYAVHLLLHGLEFREYQSQICL